MGQMVFYFSGTGNNFALAKCLCEKSSDMEMMPITGVLNKPVNLVDYDTIGFVVPSYYGHIPLVVSKAIEKLKFYDYQKIFTIIACGGGRGRATEDIREAIGKKGGQVNYEYMFVCPGNFILVYGAFPKFYQQLVIGIGKWRLRKVVRALKYNHKERILKKSSGYKEAANADNLRKLTEGCKKSLEYTVSEDCVRCGKCIRMCPVDNIKMIDKKVVFSDHCEQCMGCIQWCEVKAIDYQKVAQNRRRYHHPNVYVEDIIEALRPYKNYKELFLTHKGERDE